MYFVKYSLTFSLPLSFIYIFPTLENELGYIFNFDDPEGLLDKNDKLKLQHTYFMEECMWVDENGNERGDSIDLSPTTYKLDDITTMSWDDIFKEDISIQVYDYEEDNKNGF